MQYFKDDQDESEYVYTELEPDYCHIVFPCFDQPDLKASHESLVVAPQDWEVISNSENTRQKGLGFQASLLVGELALKFNLS